MNISTPNTEGRDEKTVAAENVKAAVILPQRRFYAIWIAVVLMVFILKVFLPRSVEMITLTAILPLVAFLALAAIGQAIVMMTGGIDMSAPSTITVASVTLLALSGGSDDRLLIAVLGALAVSVAVGVINGFLVAILGLNALIVTLSVGSLVGGSALWLWQRLAAESSAPPYLANFASELVAGVPVSFILAGTIVLVLAIGLRRTTFGRRFEAVGVNSAAAYAVGIPSRLYQAWAYVLASFLYGVLALLLSGFLRNPTLDVGAPYLLAPIAAAVLGGTALRGGMSNVISVAGAAFFLIQLVQALKMVGLDSSWQTVIQGLVIVIGMGLSEGRMPIGRFR